MKEETRKKIGVVVTFNISSGGGGPRVTIDLINALHDLGKEVYLLTPFQLDHKKLEEFYGKFHLEKIFYPEVFKKYFCKESTTSRLLMIREFQNFAGEVDLIIDIDGGILHRYLPKDKKYSVWRISCVYSEMEKFPWAMKRSFIGRMKDFIKNLLNLRRPMPSPYHNIHAVDKWTEQEMIKFWNLKSAKPLLYPEIKVDKFPKRKKKTQIVIFGRIAPNKQVDKSIRVFSEGTKNFPEYKLLIMGGETADTEDYIKNLYYIIKDLQIGDKVTFIKSPHFDKLKEVLAESKVVIDSQEQISMTMTAIEGMAAGCIILAVKNAGTYLDILDKGKYGFGFETIEEGGKELEKILQGLKSGKIGDNFIKKSIKRSKDFSGDVFRRNLKEIIEKSKVYDKL